jgi:RNA-directed DNA polymerase
MNVFLLFLKVDVIFRGPWRSTKTPGINQALSLDDLKSEGLYSLRDGWIALHYPK